jgi:hypothetical protein
LQKQLFLVLRLVLVAGWLWAFHKQEQMKLHLNSAFLVDVPAMERFVS